MLKGHATPPSIAGYLPNSALAVEAMMATASIGAVWSSTSPDFGVTVSSSVLIGHVMCLKHILLYIPSFSTAYPTPLLFCPLPTFFVPPTPSPPPPLLFCPLPLLSHPSHSQGVLDRFSQIKPKVIFSVEAVRYNRKVHSHMEKLRNVVSGM